MRFRYSKNIVLLFSCVLLLFCCNTFKNENNRIKSIDENDIINLIFIFENYERDDLFYILGIGSNEETVCTWKISIEELNKQEYFTINEIINYINVNKLLNYSNYFLNNYFFGMYKNRMYFHSIEYITVNNKQFGENINIKRNDWIIVLSYNDFYSNFNEKIFFLPDYRIIISSNNFEYIDIK